MRNGILRPILDKSLSPNKGAGVLPPLPAFAYQAETASVDAAFTAAGSAWNVRRKKSYDRMVRRAKAAGIWNKITHLYVAGASEAQWLVNLRNPGVNDLTKVGSPTFSANDGVTTASASDYYDTGLPVSAVGRNNNHLSLYSLTAASVAANDVGAINGSSQGFAIAAFTNNGIASARNFSAAANPGLATRNNGFGLTAIARGASTDFNAHHHGSIVANAATASLDLSSLSTTITILKANGSGAFSQRKISMVSIGQYLTPAEMEQWNAIIATYIQHVRFGDLDINEAGFALDTDTYDAVVYGTTAQGVVAAYSLARLGYNVALCGGWRDHPGNLGGMSACGLGATDFNNKNAFGGLTRDIWIYLNNLAQGGNMANLQFVPLHFRQKCLSLLDGARSGGYSVPIFYSVSPSGAPGGVTAVGKTGTRVTSLTMADGRVFKAKYVIDTSYEGDVLSLAGCTMVTGREAAGTGWEVVNGFLGTQTANRADQHQFLYSTTNLNIDPFVVSGDTGSGLIAGVTTRPALADGAADNQTQAYNFRMSLTRTLHMLAAMPSTPPTGYSKANYEALLRYMAAMTTAGETTWQPSLFLLINSITGPYTDINNFNGFSTDLMGGSAEYVAAANYAAREVSWKKHENYIRGLFYVMQYEADARVPATLKTNTLTYGFTADHYLDPHPNDNLYWPPQLYVREFRRLVGDYVHDANDLTADDGTTPRSIKTISTVSYNADSHHGERFADNYSGSLWRLWNEGNFEVTTGGTDKTAPLPLEAVMPKTTECTNLATTFCYSSTHAAFGAIRMEITAMQVAESLAYVIDEAIKSGNQNLQAVNYGAVRTALLAAPDTTPPVIPQVN